MSSRLSHRIRIAIVTFSIALAVIFRLLDPTQAEANTCSCSEPLVFGVEPGEEKRHDRLPDIYCGCIPPEEIDRNVQLSFGFGVSHNGNTYGIRSIQAVQHFSDDWSYDVEVFSASVNVSGYEEFMGGEDWSPPTDQELVTRFYPSPARVKSLFRWRNEYGKPWSSVDAYSGPIRIRLVRHTTNANLGSALGGTFGWVGEFYGRLIRHVADPTYQDYPYEFKYDEYYRNEDVFRKYFSNWLRRHISEYAAVDLDAAFAECFALFMGDKPESKGLPKPIRELFKDMISGRYPGYLRPREDIKEFYEERWAPPILALIRESNRNPEALLRKEPTAILGHELLAYNAFRDMQE